MNSFRHGIGCVAVVLFASARAAAQHPVPLAVGQPARLDSGVTTNVGGVSAAYNSTDQEFRVFWYDSRIVGQNDVYSRRVALDGTPLGEDPALIADSASKTDTSAAYDPVLNRYLVTWRSQAGNPGSPGFNHTYGALASAQGGLATQPVDLSNGGLEPSLVFNAREREFFLEARNFAGGGTAGIRGQRISAAGLPIDGGLTIATAGAPGPAGQADWSDNANGPYLATWRDQVEQNLKGRIIHADGSFGPGPFVISAVFPSSGSAAGVAFDPEADRFLVVFGDFSGGPIRGQFVSPDGTLWGSTLTIIPGASRTVADVSFDAIHGAYLLTWLDYDTQTAWSALLDQDGRRQGIWIRLTDFGGPPRVARRASGRFLVAWADARNAPGELDVRSQVIRVVPGRRGDLNCDGKVDFFDINPFVATLIDPAAQQSAAPDCPVSNADVNDDGQIDFLDLNPFVALLSGP